MKLYSLLIAFLLFSSVKSSRFHSWPYDCEKSSNQPHSKLRDFLLCDYDPNVRPKLEHKNATKIVVKLLVKSFTYDTLTQMLTVNSWAAIYWQDDHLKWDPANYQDVAAIHLSSDSIWTPDLSIYNRFHQSDDAAVIGTVDCFISRTGNVICIPPAKFETLCTADLTNFPFDVQTCKLYFGSWVHPGEELDIQLNDNPVELDELAPNPEWKLLNVSYKKHQGVYDCCPNSTYPMVIYIFTIQRRSSFHEATVVAPSLGLLIMCLLVQFMDVREVERFALTICNIICHTMFMQYISWQVQTVGDNVPRIILFGRDSLIIVFIQLIITIILRNITKPQDDDSPRWMSGVVSTALESRIGQTVLVLDFSMKGIAKTKSDDDSANIIENTERHIQKDCLLFAKLVDRVCFVIFIITYTIMFISLIIF